MVDFTEHGTIVETRLRTLARTFEGHDELAGAMRHALLTPGKRLRPLVTILAADELGVRFGDALDAGCALEMVHAASLVLDDLPDMDDAPMRRGQLSTHAAFGVDTAILASFSMISAAFATVTSASLPAEMRCRLVLILAKSIGTEGLARGQLHDLRGVAAAKDVVIANRLKTGSLFIAAAEMACVVANATPADQDRMIAFADHLGQAFQILDDLEDGLRTSAERSAEDDGKATGLSVLGQVGARRRLDKTVRAARGNLRRGSRLDALVGQIFGLQASRPDVGAVA